MSNNDLEQQKFYLNKFSTRVVGIFHLNEQGNLRNDIIHGYLEGKVPEKLRYHGYTDEMMKSKDFFYLDKIYEYNYSEVNTVRLVKEVENPFDVNPVKVYHNELGDLGYIPFVDKQETIRIMEETEIFFIEISFAGGKYKQIDVNTGDILHKESQPCLKLDIFYEK